MTPRQSPPSSRNISPAKPIPVRRKVIYALAVSSMLLGFFLLVAELGLTVAGYGHPGTFFLPSSAKHLTANPQFPYRYFGKSVPPRDAHWVHLAKRKQEGSYRIFILGGSAALGVPSPDFHFGRFLKVMLTEACPNQSFEIHNVALTAINSHVVRDIAAECVLYEPDLMIVYLGNNEVVGPFGPGSVFEGVAENLSVLRMSLAVKNTRIGQWLSDLAAADSGPSDWEGLQMFLERTVPGDDPRLARVYDHLRANLTAICNSAEQADASVLLGTVAVNLKDCPPFASSGTADSKFIQEVARSLQNPQASGTQWIPEIRSALATAPESAMLHYLLGQCLLRAGEQSAATKAFAEARDLDLLRFRADRRVNEIIREVAHDQAEKGVQLVDVEQALAESAPAGVPGNEYFYEHVHFNPQGQYALARTFFPKVIARLPDGTCRGTEATIPSFSRCCQALALTDLEKRGILKATLELIDKPPFVDQLSAEDRRQMLEAEVTKLETMLDDDQGEMAQVYEKAIERDVTDLILRKLTGRFLLATGRTGEAAQQFRALLEAIPTSAQAMLLLGETAYAAGDYQGARKRFEVFLDISPDRADALSQIAGIYLREGEGILALEFAEQAYAVRPDRLSNLRLLSQALLAAGQVEQAYQMLQRLGSIRPDDPQVRRELARAAVQRKDFARAVIDARACLKQRSDDRQARLVLAMALAQLGQAERALNQYAILLKDRPISPLVEKQFLSLLRSLGRDGQAFAWCQERLKSGSDFRIPLAELVLLQALSQQSAIYNPHAALLSVQRLERLFKKPDLYVLELRALAEAENGNFIAARKTVEQALLLARKQQDRQAAFRLEQQIKRIEAGKKPSQTRR